MVTALTAYPAPGECGALQPRARSAAKQRVTWANLCALAIGSAVAVVGGVLNVPSLMALGGTIVGGVLGNSMPSIGRGHGPAAAQGEPPPTSSPRRRRRRLTPPGPFGPEATVRNRLGAAPSE